MMKACRFMYEDPYTERRFYHETLTLDIRYSVARLPNNLSYEKHEERSRSC